MATVRAMAETTLVEIRKETLTPLLEGNPALVEQHEPLAARIARFFGLTGRR